MPVWNQPESLSGGAATWNTGVSRLQRTEDISLWEADNLVLLNFHGFPVVLDHAGSVIPEISSELWPLLGMYDISLPDVAGCALRSGSGFLAYGDEESANYCHWLLDMLTRVGALWESGIRSGQVWLPTPVLSWQFEFTDPLSTLGYSPRWLTQFGAARIDTLTFASNYGARLKHPAHQGANFSLRFLNQLWPDAAYELEVGRVARKLLVSRGDARQRALIGEEDLFKRLEPAGFEMVVPGDLSAREQAMAFRGASTIVGTHGAGLANCAYCLPGTNLIEITGDLYHLATYEFIARARELNYSFLVGDNEGLGTAQANIRISVDEAAQAILATTA